MTTLPTLGKLSPIIKPVAARCNIACDYCYYKNSHNNLAHGGRMSDEVLRRVVDEVVRLAAATGQPAEFTWHGGEPTLAGLEFYRRAVEYQRRAAEPANVALDNNIQTNATLLDREWMTFAKENNFTFGISLDGPRWLHDTHRVGHHGRGTFDEVMRSIRLLQESDLRFGVLAVITSASVGHAEEIIDFMIAHDLYQFDLSPCGELPGTEGIKYTIRPEEYATFMISAFEHWLAYDDPKLEVRFFKQTLYGLLGAEPGLCSMSGKFCGAFPTITPNGDVFFCDNYEGSEDMLIGNLMDAPLDELLFRPTSRHLAVRREVWAAKQQCVGCDWYRICGGGCPRYARSTINESYAQLNYFCPAYKKIIGHIAARARQILPAGVSLSPSLN